ncbi:hypothetical protein [Sorangium sp. So ce341]|uniref:hypothetical protein n=1 Tax=Sorangium sp. So ce341 TaxID=3133302 RepID=UPI003F6392A9
MVTALPALLAGTYSCLWSSRCTPCTSSVSDVFPGTTTVPSSRTVPVSVAIQGERRAPGLHRCTGIATYGCCWISATGSGASSAVSLSSLQPARPFGWIAHCTGPQRRSPVCRSARQ